MRAGRNTLLQRAELAPVHHCQQLRLAAQDDLQQLFLVRVGVSQKANFFEQFRAQQVCLVDEEHRRTSAALRLEQHLVQSHQAARLAC